MRAVAVCFSATIAAAAVLSAAEREPRPQAPRINVGGIVNAATSRPAPDNFISPGALVSIYGTGLAKVTRTVLPSDVVNGFLPIELGNVSVFFGQVQAPLLFVSPLQINAQAPIDIRPGEWLVRVRVQTLEGSEKVLLKDYSPGLFLPFRHCDGAPVARETPARPGEIILFFGTGFGQTAPPIFSGQFAPQKPIPLDPRTSLEATIGGIPLAADDILFAGLAPGYAGLYQFNLRVPTSAPSGDLEVSMKVGEEWTPPGLRIAVEGPPAEVGCPDKS
ncbi:MAG: hypothetical protein HY236_03435 [Acidobacteria bacterium]|nr:hypothetical protein [Acidobacteriota bacterium]